MQTENFSSESCGSDGHQHFHDVHHKDFSQCVTVANATEFIHFTVHIH